MSTAADSPKEVSRGRKVAAALSMLGTGGIILYEAIGRWHTEWLLVAFSAMLGAAAIGITRRSLVAQVLSRASAWIVLLPSALVVFFSLLRGSSVPFELLGMAAGTASALLLARPMLHTKEAGEDFAPKAFRRVFLAGSTATAATGFVTGAIALDAMPNHVAMAAGFTALTLSLFASAIGVVRMRGWGILLGAVTSFGLLVSAAFMRGGEGLALALAAAPALLMHLLPVFIARLVGTAPDTSTSSSSSTLRIDDAEFTPAHYRIADATRHDDDSTRDVEMISEQDANLSDAPRGFAARA